MISFDQIQVEIQKYYPQANMLLLEKAYQFSEKMHAGQKRASGQPYFVHPAEVALTLAEMRMDVPSVVAGLLHDTLEDTMASLKQLRQEFGEEIALLVDGVTKLGKIKFSSKEQKQAENFRKMVMAMSQDIRVILIKLADRLNNMRTLQYLPENKRQRIAQETFDIYAPIANRLGIQWMKVELEDLSLRSLKPESYQEIQSKLSHVMHDSQPYINQVVQMISQKLEGYQIPHRIYGRLKHPTSIHRKMTSQNLSFEQIQDLIAFRVIVDSVPQCYAALGLLHELWKPVPGRFKDYIAMPKANNYRSLHTTLICLNGERAEFQIRTQEMHEVAESGIAAHWQYKEGGKLNAEDQKKFQWVQQLLNWQQELKDPAEFLDTIKLDLFVTDVYVFTPKGEVRALPHGATPLDFAFAIHSNVGTHCVGAKINEKIVPLSTVLRSGDTVEILTSAKQRPSKDWLQFAVTSRAKTKIRQHIRSEQREKSIQLGRDLIEKEFEKLDLNPSKYLKGDAFERLLKDFGFSTFETLAMNVGYGKFNAIHLISKLVPREDLANKLEIESPDTPGVVSRIFKKVKERTKSIVNVNGHDDILVSLGKCCSPLPGDSITGFITRGRGVMVHTSDCSKVLATDSERRIDVAWGTTGDHLHHARLKVVSADRPGLLASMTKIISNDGINISQAAIRTTNDQKAINTFEVEIRNTEQLTKVIRALEKMSGVISVERVRG